MGSLWWFLSSQFLLAFRLLDHWDGRDLCPVLPPTAPPASPEVSEPSPPSASPPLLPRLPHWGPGAEMDGEAEPSPPDGLIYGGSFPSRQSGGPRGLAWRALGTATVSGLTAPGSQSAVMPSTKRPLQNGRHPSCGQPGICLKEPKPREQQQ